jgi:hypothetical protein
MIYNFLYRVKSKKIYKYTIVNSKMKKSLAVSLGVLLLVSLVAFSFVLADNSTANVNTSYSNNSGAASSGSGNVSALSNATVPPVNGTLGEPGANGTPRPREPPIRINENHSAITPTFARINESRPLPYPNMPGKDSNEINSDKTQSLSNELVCRINFNIGVLSAIMSASPNSTQDLQPVLTQLQNFLSQVQAGNSTNISTFSQDYAGEMKSAVGLVNSWKSHEGDKISLSVRAQLVASYRNLSSGYSQCEGNAFVNISQQRINDYQMQINNFQNQSNNLANRGFNTTSLDQILADAQTQIIVPLQTALSSANDSASVKQALGSYCLFDGCVNGTNFHLEAKFNIARLNIILSDLQANSAAFGLDDSKLSQAAQDLANAQSTLDTVGTSAYQKGQAQTISGYVNDASKIIVQLMKQALSQPIGGLK